MKIAQILYSGLGGHGSVAFSLQDAARADPGCDWQSSMVFLGIEPVLEDYLALCAARGLEHRYVAATEGRPWHSWGRLGKALHEVKPDAILLHSVKTILPCWLYAKRHRLPLIAVEHQPNLLKSRSEWVASRLLMRLADAVVVLTPDYHAHLKQALGPRWRADKVHVIPNGIDTRDFSPAGDRTRQGPRRIGMAARFSHKKRQDLLVGALEILKDRDGADAWRLSLAGDGEAHAGIARQVARAGLGDMVDLPGFLGGDSLRDWFGGLDLYAHATDGETLPTSVLQAMACGLPILGSDVPGMTDLLTGNGQIGLLADAETPEAFAAGLTRLAEDPDLADDLGTRARARAVETYSQEAMFAAYRSVLEGICARKSST